MQVGRLPPARVRQYSCSARHHFAALKERVRLVIVSQICETMIRMSHLRLAALLLGIALSAAVTGCCGGASSHKCDFTSLDSQKDAGSDGPIMCGTAGVCAAPTVCCAQRIAPYFSCVPLADFGPDQCEKPPPITPMCTMPTDCDAGSVCCAEVTAQTVACQPVAVCQAGNNYIICTTDRDCPIQAPGSCSPFPGTGDAGYGISVCAPSP